jgi:cytochrome b subunit of formate dehydrogenase
MLKTSRPNLRFDTTIETSPDGIGSVLIKIKGDEALEKFDGVLFHILFSGSQNINWKVIGRIKGAPEGFQPKDWAKIHSTRYPPRTWFLLVFGCLALGFPSSILLIEDRRPNQRNGHWYDWISFIIFFGGLEFIFLSAIFTELSYKVLPLWLLK